MSAERVPSARAALEAEYEIVRQLGLGGTAVVYLARRRSTGEEVAIKLIRAAYLEDEEALARFAREARFASRLDHPNIVPIREVLPLGGGGVALVMAHVTGRTLKQVIRDEGRLAPQVAERILRDVAGALGAAHAMDIIHRDVKPENIFVDDSGRALLADFGLARSTTGDTGVTMTGVAIGTPTYMPPEQIDGGALDARGDIYSLGLVGWEMLTGNRPWDGDSLYALLYHQRHDYLPDVREVRQDVPDTLADVIAAAIQKSPDQRWQNVSEMIAALDGVIPARRASTRPWVSDTMRIPRAAFAVPENVVGPPAVDDSEVVQNPAIVAAHRRTPSSATPAATHDALASIAEEIESEKKRSPLVIVFGGLLAAVVLVGAVFGLRYLLTPADERTPLPVAVVSAPDAAVTQTAAPVAPAQTDSQAARQAAADSVAAQKHRSDSVAASRTNTIVGLRDGDVARPESLSRAPVTARTNAPPAKQRRADVQADPPPQPVAPPPAKPTTSAIQPATTPAPSRASIVAGGMHTCLVEAEGRGYCWGANTRGQLGTSSNARFTSPTPIGGILDMTAITAGLSHSCGLVRDGTASCWGDNDRGQLGDRSTTNRSSPSRVADGHAFRAISAGASHTCGLDVEGAAWCWGAGSDGQLGNGSTKDSNVPVAVANGHFAAIAAGWNFTCALDAGGRAFCWGANESGQLGVRDTLDRAQPTLVATVAQFTSIAAGATHACAVAQTGEAYCWGKNTSGQLGDGTTISRATPARVKSDAHFTSITTGAAHTCAIANTGRAFCWGLGSYGQLGDGATDRQLQPVVVTGGHDFASLHAFGSHTCGTTVSGEAFCWGYNLEGQLGDGTRTNRSRPVYLEPPVR